jgi:TonB family protein
MRAILLATTFSLIVILNPFAQGGGTSAASDHGKSSEQSTALDRMPEMIGGMEALAKAIVYPKSALEDNAEGTVHLRVTVSVEGKSEHITVEKSVRQDLDQAAINALQSVQWSPAQKNHAPLAVTVVVPIKFRLEEKSKSKNPK